MTLVEKDQNSFVACAISTRNKMSAILQQVTTQPRQTNIPQNVYTQDTEIYLRYNENVGEPTKKEALHVRNKINQFCNMSGS